MLPSPPDDTGVPTEVADRVRAALERDAEIPHPEEIAVSADEIGTVTLRGTVGSPQQKHAAAADAAAQTGVFEVWNQLEVSLFEPDHREDDALRGRVLQALMSNPDLPAQRIEVTVRDGWVTLEGEVTQRSERELALTVVSQLPELTGVTNEIRVVSDPLEWMTTEGDSGDVTP